MRKLVIAAVAAMMFGGTAYAETIKIGVIGSFPAADRDVVERLLGGGRAALT